MGFSSNVMTTFKPGSPCPAQPTLATDYSLPSSPPEVSLWCFWGLLPSSVVCTLQLWFHVYKTLPEENFCTNVIYPLWMATYVFLESLADEPPLYNSAVTWPSYHSVEVQRADTLLPAQSTNTRSFSLYWIVSIMWFLSHHQCKYNF